MVLRLLKDCAPGQVFVACPNEAPYSERYKALIGQSATVPIPHRAFSIGALFRLRRFLDEREISVIHSHGFGAGLYSRALHLLTGCPCIHTHHGFLLAGPGPLARVFRLLIEAVLSLATNVYAAVSPSEYRRMARCLWWARKRMMLVSNGLGSVPVPGPPANDFTGPLRVLTASRLVDQKDPLALCDIAAALRRRNILSRFRFLVVGDGPLHAALRSAIERAGLTDAFELAGATENPRPYYESAHLYISTAKDEGLPLSVLDAMAYGLPVVATAIGPHRDLVAHQQSGLLFHPGNYDEAAEQLMTLAGDWEKRSAFGLRAREIALAEYNPQRMIAGYEHCYELATGMAVRAI